MMKYSSWANAMSKSMRNDVLWTRRPPGLTMVPVAPDAEGA